jgi:hypothetical protein
MEKAVTEPVPHIPGHYLWIQKRQEKLLAVPGIQFSHNPYRSRQTPAQDKHHSNHKREDESIESRRIYIPYHTSPSFRYIRLIPRIRCLVFIPRGQTIMHFPQSMHACIIRSTSPILPLCKERRTFLMLMPENSPAMHVALHDPQAIHLAASGSFLHSSLNKAVSALSISIAELFDNLKPNMLISFQL